MNDDVLCRCSGAGDLDNFVIAAGFTVDIDDVARIQRRPRRIAEVLQSESRADVVGRGIGDADEQQRGDDEQESAAGNDHAPSLSAEWNSPMILKSHSFLHGVCLNSHCESAYRSASRARAGHAACLPHGCSAIRLVGHEIASSGITTRWCPA